jgi:hypothetical protein
MADQVSASQLSRVAAEKLDSRRASEVLKAVAGATSSGY